jgi:sulfoxide reductase heme-binding subunit YedZ
MSLDSTIVSPRTIVRPASAPPKAVAGSKARGPLRLTATTSVIVIGLVVLAGLYATDQIVPATSEHQAQLRIWLAARAAGLASLGLLAVQILIGLVLSHPTNRTTWRLSKAIFPWHEHIWVFVFAFIALHVVSLIADPYAGVGVTGAFIPGMSEYRSAPVALGTLALYAFVLTAVTARWTKLLPPGVWLVLHRFAIVVFAMSWLHGLLAGTDSPSLEFVYVALGLAVLAATAHRYWVVRRQAGRARPAQPEVAAE